MKTSWNKGLNAQQKAEMKHHFEASGALRERLKVLLQDKIESARSSTRSSNSYDNPNWALVQADSIGYERAILEIISLIT